jgi:two-component system, chemotaxis family, chemotaxis protein CheY
MKKNVLIVDDFEITRNVMGASLEKMGVQTLKAANGDEAKRFFHEYKIDLLITDLNMPIMNGIELIKYVRLNLGDTHMPILMLTTEVKTEKKQAAHEAGATMIMQKPYDSKLFGSVVNKMLNL